MIITKTSGNLAQGTFDDKTIDYLHLDYTDAQKSILRANTAGGRDMAIRLDLETKRRGLRDGDVLWEDGDTIVVVAIEPAEVVLVSPGSYAELAQCCYEVGNRHAPLYYFTDPTRPDGVPKLAVLRDGAMDDLFAKLGVPHETCFLKLDESARLKLVTGAHHHHHDHD